MYLKLSRHVHIVYNFATFQFYGITGIGIGLKKIGMDGILGLTGTYIGF